MGEREWKKGGWKRGDWPLGTGATVAKRKKREIGTEREKESDGGWVGPF